MKNLQQFLRKVSDSQVPSDSSTTPLRFPYDPDTIGIYDYRTIPFSCSSSDKAEVKESPSITAEDEQEYVETENEDFIALTIQPQSSDSDILLDMVIGILDKTGMQRAQIERAFHQPIPSLSQFNVSDAIYLVKQSLERNQSDVMSWIVYLKLFLSLGIDLRIFLFNL